MRSRLLLAFFNSRRDTLCLQKKEAQHGENEASQAETVGEYRGVFKNQTTNLLMNNIAHYDVCVAVMYFSFGYFIQIVPFDANAKLDMKNVCSLASPIL